VKRSDKGARSKFVFHRRQMVLATAAAFFPVRGASGETASRDAQLAAGLGRNWSWEANRKVETGALVAEAPLTGVE